MLKPTHGIASLVAALVLAGCGGGGQEPSPPAPTPSPTSPATTPSSTSPAPERVPPTSPPTVDRTPPAPPPRTTSPDPSTAGSLDETSLPQEWLGFTPEVVDPSEGEFNPNGTWVHGQDSTLIAGEALPPCGGTIGELPVPTAALTGTYRDPSNAPGNGIALEFVSAQQAGTWFEGYVEAVTLCQSAPAGFEVMDIAVEDASTLRDLRDYQGMVWAERVWVEDTVVQLMIVQGDFTLTQTAQQPR